MNITRTFRLILLACLLAGLLLGCRKQSRRQSPRPPWKPAHGTPTPEPIEQVVVLVADEIRTLEPYRMVNVRAESSLAGHLWDTLTFVNGDLELEPGLATSWQLDQQLYLGVPAARGDHLSQWRTGERRGRALFHRARPVDARLAGDLCARHTTGTSRGPGRLYDSASSRARPTRTWPTRSPRSKSCPQSTMGKPTPNNLPKRRSAPAPTRSQSGLPENPSNWRPSTAIGKARRPGPRSSLTANPTRQARLQALRDGTATLVTDLEPIRADEWDIPDADC